MPRGSWSSVRARVWREQPGIFLMEESCLSTVEQGFGGHSSREGNSGSGRWQATQGRGAQRGARMRVFNKRD